MTSHKLIIGNCSEMHEINDESIHLVVTSPPYYNAPFDYENLYKSYSEYLNLLKKVARELFRVLVEGRIIVLNIDDMLVKGIKFPLVADATKIFQKAGFRYRERIIWKKPDGYIRISRRSGVLIQHPYPMYFYPDNLLESILIFQKNKFDYKSMPQEIRDKSLININEFQKNKWYLTIWAMTNVLPSSKLENGIAAFPEELPYRAIKLFSYIGETVLDPFVGSGTTMKVARELNRNSIGIEINKSLLKIIKEKVGFDNHKIDLKAKDALSIIMRK